MTSKDVIAILQKLGDSDIAEHSRRYFKAGAGEYGEGDVFLGIRVPVLRKHVKQFQALSLSETRKLLTSRYHEVRLFALLLLVRKFSTASADQQEKIFGLYLKHTRYINNWDLVDTSAPPIVGAWLAGRDRAVLYELAHSGLLWERRIAIIATARFIRDGQYRDTLDIADILLHDDEDLIHKAVGWMLREVGKRDRSVEEKYLRTRYRTMPRTMLRYAIEKFEPARRSEYLQGSI